MEQHHTRLCSTCYFLIRPDEAMVAVGHERYRHADTMLCYNLCEHGTNVRKETR